MKMRKQNAANKKMAIRDPYGGWKLRIYHRKATVTTLGKGTCIRSPRYLVKCGCCDKSVEIYYDKEGLEINGVAASIHEWKSLFKPLLKEAPRKNRPGQKCYVPQTALAKSVRFSRDLMHVNLLDGRVISVPISWFPLLRMARPRQREHYEIGGGGISLHWPEIDEDLSVAGLLAGGDEQSL